MRGLTGRFARVNPLRFQKTEFGLWPSRCRSKMKTSTERFAMDEMSQGREAVREPRFRQELFRILTVC
jgi:hypothetical protein